VGNRVILSRRRAEPRPPAKTIAEALADVAASQKIAEQQALAACNADSGRNGEDGRPAARQHDQ
jgi:hypothetical protein